jgi:neutral trehalase
MFKYTGRQIINRIGHKGNGGSQRTYFSRENIPTISLVIGSCALCFQTMVLFPWHQTLSDQFETMERNMKKMEDISKQLNEQMDEIITLETAIQRKNAVVLNSSLKILSELQETEEHIQSIKKEYLDLENE